MQNAEYVKIKQHHKYRLRPSVGFVPLGNDTYEFFFFFTRTLKKIKIINQDFVQIISCLDGSKSIESIKLDYQQSELVQTKLDVLLQKLYDWHCIERADLSEIINSIGGRRVLNFFADFIKDEELLQKWNTLSKTIVCIVGCGAVGSWVSTLLVGNGIKNFVLIDNDVIHKSNLNRSLFKNDQVGHKKLDALMNNLQSQDPSISVEKVYRNINSTNDFEEIINNINYNKNLIVINCADYPNVDTTSRYISDPCMRYKIPHIIAGGYNLHLSLIGQTIIPFQSSCFECANIVLNKDSNMLTGVKKMIREERNLGNLAPLTGITASFVINEVMRIIFMNRELQPLMLNKRGEFNFFTNKIKFFDLPRQKDCPWCGCTNTESDLLQHQGMLPKH